MSFNIEKTLGSLMFPDKARPCKDFRWGGGCPRTDCLLIHAQGSSLLKLIAFLDNTKRNIEMCMATLTCEEVGTRERACGIGKTAHINT